MSAHIVKHNLVIRKSTSFALLSSFEESECTSACSRNRIRNILPNHANTASHTSIRRRTSSPSLSDEPESEERERNSKQAAYNRQAGNDASTKALPTTISGRSRVGGKRVDDGLRDTFSELAIRETQSIWSEERLQHRLLERASGTRAVLVARDRQLAR